MMLLTSDVMSGDLARAAELYELADHIAPTPEALRNATRSRLAAGQLVAAATHAEELSAASEPQLPGTIDAGRQRQRDLGAGGLVDGALQGFGLIVRAAGTHAILGSIAPERGDRLSGARCLRRPGERRGQRHLRGRQRNA